MASLLVEVALARAVAMVGLAALGWVLGVGRIREVRVGAQARVEIRPAELAAAVQAELQARAVLVRVARAGWNPKAKLARWEAIVTRPVPWPAPVITRS